MEANVHTSVYNCKANLSFSKEMAVQCDMGEDERCFESQIELLNIDDYIADEEYEEDTYESSQTVTQISSYSLFEGGEDQSPEREALTTKEDQLKSKKSSDSNILIDSDPDSSNARNTTQPEKVPQIEKQESEIVREGSITDAFVKQTLIFNPNDFLIPPPELIKKSVITTEEAQSGAQIAFLKLQRLIGLERMERMNADNQNRGGPNDRNGDISMSSNIGDYLINCHNKGQVVYCRLGEKYIQDLEKRKNSSLANSNQPSTSFATASYLINIKKLIEEHNINGEKKDFKTMKTSSMSSKIDVVTQYYKPTGPDDKTLIFESRFESGNLLAAIKISDNEYDLVLQNDINTNGHTQWFFYRVTGGMPGQRVRFNIINLAKPDSLYNYGMKILCFSNKQKAETNIGWHRVGENISYYQNDFKKEQGNFYNRTFFTLTFTHVFKDENDSQFFAHCFPYTYSDLQDDMSRIEKDSYCSNFYHRSTLCRTLAGNKCEYITITSRDKDPNSAKAMNKKGVFISARVHPGESNSSWMMKGIIEFLISNTPEAKALRDHFVFKIVPILNPDGVINGNYRCSLSGQDLNRRWKNPSRVLHPVIFNVKRVMRVFSKERELMLYCDLHGHSRRKNIFMYGNTLKDTPHATRVFPYIMSKLCDFFSFEQSRFSISKSKESTARVAMYRELNITNIFTMEASFCGADKGVLANQHFTTEHLMLAGRRLMESLIVFSKIEVPNAINEINYKQISVQEVDKELASNKALIKLTSGREDGESSGSDSAPSEDNLDEEQMAEIVPIKEAKPKEKPIEPPKPAPVKELPKPPEKKKPSSPKKEVRPVVKEITRTQPQKKTANYNPFDRLSLRKRKPEMKDAWTQTTPRPRDERRAKRHREQKEQQLLQQQAQQNQGHPQQRSSQMQSTKPGSQQVRTDIQQDSSTNPQPQIRIRKENYKVKPSNDLAQFEHNLLKQPEQIQINSQSSPVQFSNSHIKMATKMGTHELDSNKKLPNIASSQQSQREELLTLQNSKEYIQTQIRQSHNTKAALSYGQISQQQQPRFQRSHVVMTNGGQKSPEYFSNYEQEKVNQYKQQYINERALNKNGIESPDKIRRPNGYNPVAQVLQTISPQQQPRQQQMNQHLSIGQGLHKTMAELSFQQNSNLPTLQIPNIQPVQIPRGNSGQQAYPKPVPGLKTLTQSRQQNSSKNRK